LREALTPVIDRNRTAACRLGNFVFERRGAVRDLNFPLEVFRTG
jgi:hypothetical protein